MKCVSSFPSNQCRIPLASLEVWFTAWCLWSASVFADIEHGDSLEVVFREREREREREDVEAWSAPKQTQHAVSAAATAAQVKVATSVP